MTPPPSAKIVDAAALADELARRRVVDPARLAAARSEFASGDASALAAHLTAAGLLTTFQAERAVAGQSSLLALGPYRLTERLKDGLFGPSYHATDVSGTKSFFVRVFPLRSLWQVRVAKRLVRSLATLPAHTAIVPISDVDSANGYHYLVWPRVLGERLADRVAASGPLLPAEAATYLRQIAEALAICHRRGVEHGLLNPHTIALGSDGQARLLELGAGQLFAQNLADAETMVDSFSSSTAAVSMLSTAAPELLADPRALSPAVDQYGLGIIAHFALTGLLPFEEDGLAKTLLARQSAAGPIRDLDPALLESLAAVVDRLLAVDPSDRFTSLEEVVEALTAVLVELGIAAPTPPPQEPAEAPASQVDSTNRSTIASPTEGKRSGSVSWSGPRGSGSGVQPAERDDTDDSIQFDLPDAASPIDVPLTPQFAPAAVRVTPPVVAEAEPAARVTPFRFATPSPDKSLPIQAADTPPEAMFETRPGSGNSSKSGRLSGVVTPSPDAGRVNPLLPKPPIQDSGSKDSLLLDSLNDSNASAPPILPTIPNILDPSKSRPSSSSNLPKISPSGSGFRRKPSLDPPVSVDPDASDETVAKSVLWKAVRRNLLFWQAPTDKVQVSLFGPASFVPGQTVQLEMFLHQPDAAESVRTMSRAFIRDSELIGSGIVAKEISRESKVAVHIVIANANVSQSLLSLVWRGQPHRLSLDMHVPWESPSGLAAGVVSIGQENVRVGKVDFTVNILPRTS